MGMLSLAGMGFAQVSMANKCDEKLGNYEEAIGWYENVLTDPSAGFNDSVFAAIDLGDLYLRMEENGVKGIGGKLMQYNPVSKKTHNRKIDLALSLLPQSSGSIEITDDRNMPIRDLEVFVLGNDTVFFTWNYPDGYPDDSINLSWIIADSINTMSQYGYDSYMGAMYDELDLCHFIDWSIESISFFKVSNWTHVIYIWEQKQDETMHVLYSQNVPDETPFGLNIVLLDEVIHIEPNTRYWFALRITHQQGQQGYTYPFGMVYGAQVVEGKSNLLMDPISNSWMTIPYGQQFWIKARLKNLETENTNLQNSKEISDLTGYRIYRDGTLIKEIPYSFVTYFTDTEFTRETDVEYCVTAVYGEEESEPVCATATITGVGEAMTDDAVTLSPNPTNGIVQIDGATAAEVKVYNASGQLVKTVLNTNQIDMSQLHEGFYLLRITATDGRVHVGKVTVNK